MQFPKGIGKAPEPKMTDVLGKSWTNCDVILPDGTTITGKLESKKGKYFYFLFNDRWYNGAMNRFEVTNDQCVRVFSLRQGKPIR